MEDCDIVGEDSHTWFCKVHGMIFVASRKEPVGCPVWSARLIKGGGGG